MRTIAIDDPVAWTSENLSRRAAKIAEWIEVLLGVETLGDTRNTGTLLDGDPHTHDDEGCGLRLITFQTCYISQF